MIRLGKSAPSQNRQLIVLIGDSEQQSEDRVGKLTFQNHFSNRFGEMRVEGRPDEAAEEEPPPHGRRTPHGDNCFGCRVEGWGFRVWGSGLGVQGLGFRVQDVGFRLQGSGFRVKGLGCRVWGLRFGVQCCVRFYGLWFMFRA